MIRKISLCILLVILCDSRVVGQTVERNSKEYCFLLRAFERTNGIKNHELNADQQKELDDAFDAVSDTTKEIQRLAPGVTLGGMLSIVVFESGVRPAFFNTIDNENSFNPDRKNKLPKLDANEPFWQQPLARYSYQVGIIPIHTSIFRPCVRGTQAARLRFDNLAKEQGFAPAADQLASIRQEFEEVCHKAQSPVPDEPRAVDYVILNAHSKFGVPKNSSGGDVVHLSSFPLYWPRVTTPFFFLSILTQKDKVTDDESALCVWGGGDHSYCQETKQKKIFGPWKSFSCPVRAPKRTSQ
jgi:hypothetical protein